MDDIAQLRTHLVEPSRTHWDGCIESHPLCALAWALDEVEHLRVVLSDWQQTVRHLTNLTAERDIEIERLRAKVADLTQRLHWANEEMLRRG